MAWNSYAVSTISRWLGERARSLQHMRVKSRRKNIFCVCVCVCVCVYVCVSVFVCESERENKERE